MNIELQEILLGIAVTVIITLAKWIMNKAKVNDVKAEAIEAILLAVAVVKNEYIDDLKAKAVDGLTDEEKSEARKTAVSKALKIAGPKAAALILEWGEEKVRGYIEVAVAKLK